MTSQVSPIPADIGIDENFEDNRYFQVAMLVDRPDFLIQIKLLRRKWKVPKKLIPRDPAKIESWQTKIFKMTKTKRAAAIKAESRFAKKYPDWFSPKSIDEAKQFDKDIEATQRLNKRLDFSWDIRILRQKFKRPSTFDSVIKASLIHGEVLLEDYAPCYAKVAYPEVELPQHGDVPELTIVLDQFTRWEEVKKVFAREIPQAKRELLSQVDLYKKLNNPARFKTPRRDREWYWANKHKIYTNDRMTYTEIALKEGTRSERKYYHGYKKDRGQLSQWDKVAKQISRYKDLVTAPV